MRTGTMTKSARSTILATVFWVGAAAPALADWNDLGDLQLHHGGERFLRDVPLNGQAQRLRLTGSGDDIFCRSVSVTFGNGEVHEVYHGLLHRERSQDVDLGGLDQPIRSLSFQCGAQHFDNALLHLEADVGRDLGK